MPSNPSPLYIKIGDKVVNIKEIGDLGEVAKYSKEYTRCNDKSSEIRDKIDTNKKIDQSLVNLDLGLRTLNETSGQLHGGLSFAGGSSVFHLKNTYATNATEQEVHEYFDVVVGELFSGSNLSIKVEQLAENVKWVSRVFSSSAVNVTQGSGGTNPEMFKAGDIAIYKNNNSRVTQQKFSSEHGVIVLDSGSGAYFKSGNFYINDVAIALEVGDSLSAVVAKINQSSAAHGVTAAISSDLGLKLASVELGAENDYSLADPNGLWNQLANSGDPILVTGFFAAAPDEVVVKIAAGDSLKRIAEKIDRHKRETGLEASVAYYGSNKYRLALSSANSGVANSFAISDGGVVLNGSNSGAVFGDLLKDGTEAGGVAYEHQAVAPADLQLRINGHLITSPVNRFYDKQQDFAIEAKEVTPKVINLRISPDYAVISAVIKEFVDNFNAVQKLFARYTYRDEGDPGPETVFLFDYDIAGLRQVIDKTLYKLAMRDIGIEVADETVERVMVTDKDGKTISYDIAYNRLLQLDEKKLKSRLLNDFESVRQTFESYFYSSSLYFYKAFSSDDLRLWLGTPREVKDISVKVDTSKAEVKAATSIGFVSDTAAAVKVENGAASYGFAPGRFYINDVPIELTAGDSLKAVAAKINSKAGLSNVRAEVVNDSGLSFLVFYDLDYREQLALSLSDPHGCLNRVFSPGLYGDGVAMADLGFDGVDRSFSLNGVAITVPGNPTQTIENLVDVINQHESDTGVKASWSAASEPDKYNLSLLPVRLVGVVVDDPDELFNECFAPRVVRGSSHKFYETSEIAAAEFRLIGSGDVYEKRVSFYPADRNDLSKGAMLKIHNCDDSPLQVKNFSLLYGGEGDDETEVIITAGTISDMIKGLNEVVGYDGMIGKKRMNNNHEYDSLVRNFKDNEQKKHKILEKKMREISGLNRTQQYGEERSDMIKDIIESVFSTD